MGLFKKQNDPITGRARALNAEIASLEAKIRKLNNQVQAGQGPRMRSTAFPHGPTVTAAAHAEPPRKGREPIFEKVDQNSFKGQAEPATTAQHFNELGVRKFDLLALIERTKKHFRAPPLSNPKLVSYLAAGSVQGLRSLRYEKRVARNRFIVLAILLGLVLLGILAAMVPHR